VRPQQPAVRSLCDNPRDAAHPAGSLQNAFFCHTRMARRAGRVLYRVIVALCDSSEGSRISPVQKADGSSIDCLYMR